MISTAIRNEGIIKITADEILNVLQRIACCITPTTATCCQIHCYATTRRGIRNRITTRSTIQFISTRSTHQHIIAPITGQDIVKITPYEVFNSRKSIARCTLTALTCSKIHGHATHSCRIWNGIIARTTFKTIRTAIRNERVIKITADEALDVLQGIACRTTTHLTRSKIHGHATRSCRIRNGITASATLKTIRTAIRNERIIKITTDEVLDVLQGITCCTSTPLTRSKINCHTTRGSRIRNGIIASTTLKTIRTAIRNKCVIKLATDGILNVLEGIASSPSTAGTRWKIHGHATRSSRIRNGITTRTAIEMIITRIPDKGIIKITADEILNVLQRITCCIATISFAISKIHCHATRGRRIRNGITTCPTIKRISTCAAF